MKKLGSALKFRALIDPILLAFPLPRVHPDILTAISVLFSMGFLFTDKEEIHLLLLLFVLLFDWADGLVAHKYNFRKNDAEKERGWITDVASDRMSEGLIAISYFIPLFPLFIINTILSIYSFRSGRHLILPIRQLFFLYLLISLVF